MSEPFYDTSRFVIDVDATREWYASLLTGKAETCACLNCVNWVAARDHVFNSEVEALLASFGVDWHKETYVCEMGQPSPGEHIYNCHFEVVGRTVINSSVETSQQWDIGEVQITLTSHGYGPPDSPSPPGDSLCLIVWLTQPWYLDPDDDTPYRP